MNNRPIFYFSLSGLLGEGHSDLHIKIERTIKGLPAKQQQVFVMSRFEGKKNAAVAKELNLSIKTVEMHISRALSTFRKIFSEES